MTLNQFGWAFFVDKICIVVSKIEIRRRIHIFIKSMTGSVVRGPMWNDVLLYFDNNIISLSFFVKRLLLYTVMVIMLSESLPKTMWYISIISLDHYRHIINHIPSNDNLLYINSILLYILPTLHYIPFHHYRDIETFNILLQRG